MRVTFRSPSISLQTGTSVGTPLAALLAVAIGSLLTFAATRATATVTRGRTFVRWMVTVFLAYVLLIGLPILAGL